jgi:hypothetical protein
MLQLLADLLMKVQRFQRFPSIFLMSAGAPRRSNFHRADALPVEPLDQRHKLRVAEPYLRGAE